MATRAIAPILVIATSCTGHNAGPTTHDPSAARTSAAVAPTYTATQFVPAKPTYVIASRTVQGGLASIAAGIDAVGVLLGGTHIDAGNALARTLHVNPFNFAGVVAMGVDLQGGLAVFSEDVDPTFVVHLANADDTLAFFDRLRDGGLNATSVVIDNVEVYSTAIDRDITLSWAVTQEWLWVHVSLGLGKHAKPATDTRWFTASKPDAAKPAWGGAWGFASANAAHLPPSKLGLSGFVDLPAIAMHVATRVPDALACAKTFAPIGKVGIAAEVGDNKASARISLDLGTAASGVAGAILPPPEGWSEAAKQSAIGAQWNLDLDRVVAAIEPCSRALSIDPFKKLRSFGVRSARVFLDALDVDNHTGEGAVSLDINGAAALEAQLANIPMRSTFEKDKQWGALAGHELSVPMLPMPAIDYVLTDHLAVAATPEALMAAIIGSGKPAAASSAIAAFDITPGKLPDAQWMKLLELADWDSPRRVVEAMSHWQEGHASLTIDHDQLVFEARGSRR